MSRASQRIPPGPIKLRYEDYVGLPDDGRRYEILDGDLEVSPAPAPRHQAVSRNLHRIIDRHVDERRLGSCYYAPIDVILAPTTIVQPDLLFVAARREAIVTARAVEGPPDLIVEIVSSWSGRHDCVTKAALYARYGVPHYWIADPATRTLRIYRRQGKRYGRAATYTGTAEVRPALFPDLVIDLGRVWV